MEFINKFNDRTDIEKAKVYYWIYGILYTLVYILCQKFQLIIISLLNGFIFIEISIFLSLQLFVSNFRFCEVLDIEEIEKDIKNLLKNIVTIIVLHFVFNMSLFIPSLMQFKKYWEPGVVFMPGLMVFIFNHCLKLGGMGAIYRFIKRKRLQA